jgi:protein O-GlcNAc transferase
MYPPRRSSSHHPTPRVRVGYLSPDFFEHSVAHFAEALLRHADATKFRTVAFYSQRRVDARTARLKALAHAWHDVAALSTDQVPIGGGD